jgi:hypothetical protein
MHGFTERIDDKLTTTSIPSSSTVSAPMPPRESWPLAVSPSRLVARLNVCAGTNRAPAVHDSCQIGFCICLIARAVPACKGVSLDTRYLEKSPRSLCSRRKWMRRRRQSVPETESARSAHSWFRYKHPRRAIDRSGAESV